MFALGYPTQYSAEPQSKIGMSFTGVDPEGAILSLYSCGAQAGTTWRCGFPPEAVHPAHLFWTVLLSAEEPAGGVFPLACEAALDCAVNGGGVGNGFCTLRVACDSPCWGAGG